MSVATQKSPVVRLLPGTREKLEAIAEVRRWKLNTTIDALADRFLESEGIGPQKPVRRREAVKA